MTIDVRVLSQVIRAIRQKNTDDVCRLLSEYGDKIDKYKEVSPLLIAAGEGAWVAVRYLIETVGMDINMLCPKLDVTPLMIACLNDQVDVVKYLLSNPNIDANIRNNEGTTALDITLVNILVHGKETIHHLLAHSKTDITTLTRDKGTQEIVLTPFRLALTMKQWDIVESILFDPRFRVENILIGGITYLHQVITYLASAEDHDKCFRYVKRLVELGADPSIRQDQRELGIKNNWNAIELARCAGFRDIADYLEAARIKLSESRFKKAIEAKKLGNTDSEWQECPVHITDPKDEEVLYQLARRAVGL